MERKSPIFTAFIYISAVVLAAVILAPILWLFVMSISPAADLRGKATAALVAANGRISPAIDLLFSTIENSTGAAFTSSLRNSIEVAAMATIAAIALAIPAGWAVSRTPSVGWSLSMVIATYMLPPVALAVPLYVGLCLSGHAEQRCLRPGARLSHHPRAVHHLVDEIGFDSIPKEIESAAMIDGAGLFRR